MQLEIRLWADLFCCFFCFIAACWDTKTGQIPDRLTWPSLCIGIVFLIIHGNLENCIILNLFGAIIAMLLLGGIYASIAAFGGMGWGDVKLIAAVGATLGWPVQDWDSIFYFLASTILCGILLALFQAARTHKTSSPYGVAIFIGSLLAIIGRYS